MSLAEIREFLKSQRAELRRRHETEPSGLPVAHAICAMFESAIRRLFDEAVAAVSADTRAEIESKLALVAVAGFGRRDCAPFSDIDLLILRDESSSETLNAFAKRLVRDIWDVGLTLGHTLATPSEALDLAQREILPATSLLEARLLLGPTGLFESLVSRYRQYLNRGGADRIYREAIAEVATERTKNGATVQMLEPDLKEGAGGLRDLHLMRWIGLSRFETADWQLLSQRNVLRAPEAEALASAHDFLIRVRADLHFFAGKPFDSLTRSDQLRIAKSRGYKHTPALLSVERFMRDLFKHSTAVADISSRFLERTRPSSLWRSSRELLFARRAGPGIWVTPHRLFLTSSRRREIVGSLSSIIDLAILASRYEVDFDHVTLDALRDAYGQDNAGDPEEVAERMFARLSLAEIPKETKPPPSLPAPAADTATSVEVDAEPSAQASAETAATAEPVSEADVSRKFLMLLGRPGNLSHVLRRLHQVGVLERLIPEFEHARFLLQFNAYHKYTVDEHTFVMLRHAEDLIDGEDLLSATYRKIVRKDILHLAILLHDLGKGLPEDHSEVGRRIAFTAALRFALSEDETQALVYLVHQHLYLSNLAFHRDTSDPNILVQLARSVGSVEMLRKLYVLTCVDLMAVGPGNYNPWRADILTDLYRKTIRFFGGEEVAAKPVARSEEIREQLRKTYADDPRVCEAIASLPADYLSDTASAHIHQHLLGWRERAYLQQAVVTTEYRAATNTTLVTVLTYDRATEGAFYKICGCLAGHWLDVLSARIRTLPDGTVLDQFEVIDRHHVGEISAARASKIGETIQRVISGEVSVGDILWNVRSSVFKPQTRVMERDHVRVVVDNESSDEFTVIDVHTKNRRGLLYTLGKGMNRLGLSVFYAKIATYADDVVDVFYVLEFDGKKVHRDDNARLIEKHLTQDILRLATDPRSMGF